LTDLITDVSVKVGNLSGVGVRMSQDYGDDTVEFDDSLAQTNFQIRATLLNEVNSDSAASKQVAQVEVFLHFAMNSVIDDEQAYTSGVMATTQSAMLDRDWWTDLSSVFSVVDGDGAGPVVNETPERVGKLLSYSIGVQVALAP